MTNTNEWRVNDGTVPEGVGPDTLIEVWYRNGDADIVAKSAYIRADAMIAARDVHQ